MVKLKCLGQAEGSGQPDTGMVPMTPWLWCGLAFISTQNSLTLISFSEQGTSTAESTLVRMAKGYEPKIPFWFQWKSLFIKTHEL